jgi:hypothetical protein
VDVLLELAVVDVRVAAGHECQDTALLDEVVERLECRSRRSKAETPFRGADV